MVGEKAEKKVYDAAYKGDVATFQQLLHEDPYLLDQVSFACSRNLLHIATMRGQLGIVEEVLRRNPELARDLDSQKWSPLHIAAAKGNVEIAKNLLSIAPEMRWSLDCQGMNPIHIAAMNGHVGILEELVQLDCLPAMERVHRGQTVLHLCVKHRQLEALEILVEKLGELVCAKDEEGNTVLHWAVRTNQVEMVRCLAKSNKIEKLTTNSMGETALDMMLESPGDTNNNNSEIKIMLRSFSDESELQILPKMSDITMVVVILLATMAFQAAVSPPGGVWQDNSSTHKAGEAVMASTHPKVYKHFVRANTTAFISSLISIFLLSTGLPAENLNVQIIASYAMWVSLASIGVSYGASVMVITPNTETRSLAHVIGIVVSVPLSIIGVLIVGAFISAALSSWKSKRRQMGDFVFDPADILMSRLFRWLETQIRIPRRDDRV